MLPFRAGLVVLLLMVSMIAYAVGPGGPGASQMTRRLQDETRHARHIVQAAVDGDMSHLRFDALLRPALGPGILALSALTPRAGDEAPSATDIAMAVRGRLQDEAREAAFILKAILGWDAKPTRFENIRPESFSGLGPDMFAGNVSYDERTGGDMKHVTARVVVTRGEAGWKVVRVDHI